MIAGGGVAALETLLALGELAGDRVDITLISPRPDFLYQPVTVGEAFGRSEARVFSLEEIVGGRGAQLKRESLSGVHPGEHVAHTAGGEMISYDVLVVAAGAVTSEPLPGALTFRGRPDVPALRRLLDELAAGTARSVCGDHAIGTHVAAPDV